MKDILDFSQSDLDINQDRKHKFFMGQIINPCPDTLMRYLMGVRIPMEGLRGALVGEDVIWWDPSYGTHADASRWLQVTPNRDKPARFLDIELHHSPQGAYLVSFDTETLDIIQQHKSLRGFIDQDGFLKTKTDYKEKIYGETEKVLKELIGPEFNLTEILKEIHLTRASYRVNGKLIIITGGWGDATIAEHLRTPLTGFPVVESIIRKTILGEPLYIVTITDIEALEENKELDDALYRLQTANKSTQAKILKRARRCKTDIDKVLHDVGMLIEIAKQHRFYFLAEVKHLGLLDGQIVIRDIDCCNPEYDLYLEISESIRLR